GNGYDRPGELPGSPRGCGPSVLGLLGAFGPVRPPCRARGARARGGGRAGGRRGGDGDGRLRRRGRGGGTALRGGGGGGGGEDRRGERGREPFDHGGSTGFGATGGAPMITEPARPARQTVRA